MSTVIHRPSEGPGALRPAGVPEREERRGEEGRRGRRPGGRRDAVRPAGAPARLALPLVRPAVSAGCPPEHRALAAWFPVPAPETSRRAGRAVPAAVARRRRVVAAAVLVGVVVGAVVGVLGLAGTGAGTPAASSVVTVVGPGETLTAVAHRTVPDQPSGPVVERIRERNALNGSGVAPGEPLLVPLG